jgi:hypothetical protein
MGERKIKCGKWEERDQGEEDQVRGTWDSSLNGQDGTWLQRLGTV